MSFYEIVACVISGIALAFSLIAWFAVSAARDNNVRKD